MSHIIYVMAKKSNLSYPFIYIAFKYFSIAVVLLFKFVTVPIIQSSYSSHKPQN